MRRSRRGEEGGREGELNEAKNVVKTGLTKAESKPGGEWSFRIERVRISSRGKTSITTATHKGWREREGGGGGRERGGGGGGGAWNNHTGTVQERR